MNYLDICLVIPMIYGFIRGFSKGIVNEITSLVAILIGVYVAFNFSIYFEGFLSGVFEKFSSDVSNDDKKTFIPIISFAVVFLFSVVSVKAFGALINKITNVLALGIISKILGSFFGLFKVAVIISCLLYFENEVELIPKKIMKNSVIYTPIKGIAEKLSPSVKRHESILKDLEKKAEKAKKKIEKNL